MLLAKTAMDADAAMPRAPSTIAVRMSRGLMRATVEAAG
jgi:hypothetical protein